MSLRLPKFFSLALGLIFCLNFGVATAQSRSTLEKGAVQALQQLVTTVPSAKALNDKAIAVLIFPEITKAGLLVGGQRSGSV